MSSENKQVIVENREKIQTHPAKIGLAAYVDPKQVLTQRDHDQRWQHIFNDWQDLACLEIQYESDYLKNWWKNLPPMLQHYQSRVIVHGPTQKRDIASNNQQLRSRSLAENKKALDFAAELGAEAMILHITPQDDFDLRIKQLDRAIESFSELASYIKDKSLPVSLMLENLEYPKWPADTKEAIDLLKYLKSIHPNLTSCVDLAHLWHNQAALIPGTNYSQDEFLNTLINYIVEVNDIAPIHRFHFAGAYLDRVNDIHQTHGAPNFNDVVNLNDASSLSKVIDVMPNNQSLSIINEFINFQKNNGETMADIILEMHIPHLEQKKQVALVQEFFK